MPRDPWGYVTSTHTRAGWEVEVGMRLLPRGRARAKYGAEVVRFESGPVGVEVVLRNPVTKQTRSMLLANLSDRYQPAEGAWPHDE